MSKLEDALENFDMDDMPEDEESMLEWWDFDDSAEMIEAIASDIQFIIESALDARGDALLALPGGCVRRGALCTLLGTRWSSRVVM